MSFAPEITTLLSAATRKDGAPKSRDTLLDGLHVLCRLYNRPATSGELTAGLPLTDGKLTLGVLPRAAARADLSVRVRSGVTLSTIDKALLPVLIVRVDGTTCLLTSIEGEKGKIIMPEMEARQHEVKLDELQKIMAGPVIFAAPVTRSDSRADDFNISAGRHWFWSQVARLKMSFFEVAAAAALANFLALGAALFSRQVFDRVIPNQAFATLWVLTIGVGIAIVLEAITRIARAQLMDVAGKRLDVRLSSHIFERALGMRLEVRPKSTGSFVNQVREFDSVREFFTSTTIGAISDIPFVILFVGIIWLIGGPVAYVLLAAIPLIVLPGVIAQWPLEKYSRLNMKEGSIRNGLLVEAMTGAETVKSISAEGRFQRLWEEYTALLAVNSAKMRRLTNTLQFSAVGVQQAAYVMVTVVAVYQIHSGEMTVGGLLACTILSSRAIAPLTQLSGILGRWQQMRVALSGIGAIMAAPVDRPRERKFVHRPRLKGGFQLEDVAFRYDEHSEAALQVPALSFEPGSATAILGTNGSGKSTLLKMLAGLYHPAGGRMLVDGTDIRQIDPVDLRRAIAYLQQDVRLFFGTLRENLNLGLEDREDEELIEALEFVGAESLVREHPLGLDRPIGEGGSGVSGGQRQSIGLARLWLRDPRIVLLDEPTAAMDHALETRVIHRMRGWLEGRTLVVATHRQPVLALVERAVVMNHGKPAAAGPLEGVLAALSGNKGKSDE
ncbi:type I secretion system permease/ATPase [Nitratireductor sp. CH_MIT9313-5]|uniref:type I secretion system permease/ATPase n=1 Tax=Nitratireductor sp. CH_MIT9313-5 TaxID=3107764 RepID=UPI00300A29DB